MANIKLTMFVLSLVANSNGLMKKLNTPPHCTQLSKDTDYVSRYKFDYPVAYLIPGQREAHQKLFCVNPAAVAKAVTVVCDWAAPPQVSFTLGDDYVSIVRQDPSGQFLGNAVINTYQLCSHNRINSESSVGSGAVEVFITELENYI